MDDLITDYYDNQHIDDFQDLQKIERYLPLLENLVTCVEGKKKDMNVIQWTSQLAIRWTSPLSGLSGRGLKGPRYFQVDDMRYELGMTLNLYGALLRERALEVVCTGNACISA